MNRIGIMQGRVLPDQLEKLQVFPRQWKKEISLIKDMGFGQVELLDDKASVFRNLSKEELLSGLKDTGLGCGSVCMDYLCQLSFLKDSPSFFKKIEKVTDSFDENFIFVVPFFDENKISNKEELENVFKILSGHELKSRFSLEIDWPAEELKELLDKYALNNIGICFDTGNRIGSGADLAKEIEILSGHINHVHIKYKENGFNVRIKGESENLSGAFEALKKINYKGLMILETCIKPVPEEEARINLATVLKYLKQ